MRVAYSAEKIFTGSTWIEDMAIVVEEGFITSLQPTATIESEKLKYYKNCFIAPAFIDLQIYGAYNKLFSVYPTVDTLYKLYNYCLKGGAHHFLPTVATNSYDIFYKCIDAVKAYWSKGGKGVPGLHIEGPWINKAKRGAHVESFIHSPKIEDVRKLLEYGKGVIKIITLAPEMCSQNVIELIRSHGIIVSAGHSNATYNEASEAFDNGISVATHLFNAMSALQHREPGLVGAVMNSSAVMASIVPDGYHVDFAAISIAKKVIGNRLFIITDAVTETTEGPYPHKKEGEKYVSNGTLSGSALTMLKGVKNCVEHAGVPLDEALRMASTYPAQVLGLHNELGKIEEGCKAEFVVLTNDLEISVQVF